MSETVIRIYRIGNEVFCSVPPLMHRMAAGTIRYVDGDTDEDWHESEWRRDCARAGIPYEPLDSPYRAEWEARYLPRR